jgi:hypothetical protein
MMGENRIKMKQSGRESSMTLIDYESPINGDRNRWCGLSPLKCGTSCTCPVTLISPMQ